MNKFLWIVHISHVWSEHLVFRPTLQLLLCVMAPLECCFHRKSEVFLSVVCTVCVSSQTHDCWHLMRFLSCSIHDFDSNQIWDPIVCSYTVMETVMEQLWLWSNYTHILIFFMKVTYYWLLDWNRDVWIIRFFGSTTFFIFMFFLLLFFVQNYLFGGNQQTQMDTKNMWKTKQTATQAWDHVGPWTIIWC